MSLLRGLVGIVVVIMLLPSEEQQGRVVGASTGAEQPLTFCQRNPNTCAAGAEMWALFLKKAEYGAKLAASYVQDYMRKSDQERQSPLDPSHRPQGTPTANPNRGTLSPDDLAPAWRGTARTGT